MFNDTLNKRLSIVCWHVVSPLEMLDWTHGKLHLLRYRWMDRWMNGYYMV